MAGGQGVGSLKAWRSDSPPIAAPLRHLRIFGELTGPRSPLRNLRGCQARIEQHGRIVGAVLVCLELANSADQARSKGYARCRTMWHVSVDQWTTRGA
jgi:hypothetical protein